MAVFCVRQEPEESCQEPEPAKNAHHNYNARRVVPDEPHEITYSGGDEKQRHPEKYEIVINTDELVRHAYQGEKTQPGDYSEKISRSYGAPEMGCSVRQGSVVFMTGRSPVKGTDTAHS